MRAARRQAFEEDALPHLDSLWRCALWLTLDDRRAEELVLRAIARGYREWDYSDVSVDCKVRLFRTLTREYFACGHPPLDTARYMSEDGRTISILEPENLQPTRSVADGTRLSDMAGISNIAVKGAIAQLRPHSRLMLILLYRERFSYERIAYITDLSERTVSVILTRLRRLIPEYVIDTASRIRDAIEKQLVAASGNGKAGCKGHDVALAPICIDTDHSRWPRGGDVG